MDRESLQLFALIWVLGTIVLLALSYTFRRNRWGERQRGLTERIGCGIVGLIILVIVVELLLIGMAL